MLPVEQPPQLDADRAARTTVPLASVASGAPLQASVRRPSEALLGRDGQLLVTSSSTVMLITRGTPTLARCCDSGFERRVIEAGYLDGVRFELGPVENFVDEGDAARGVCGEHQLLDPSHVDLWRCRFLEHKAEGN